MKDLMEEKQFIKLQLAFLKKEEDSFADKRLIDLRNLIKLHLESEKKRIFLEFKHAYHKCKLCFDTTENEIQRDDFHQRIDELLLLYSNIFDVSVNKSREELGRRLSDEVRK